MSRVFTIDIAELTYLKWPSAVALLEILVLPMLAVVTSPTPPRVAMAFVRSNVKAVSLFQEESATTFRQIRPSM